MIGVIWLCPSSSAAALASKSFQVAGRAELFGTDISTGCAIGGKCRLCRALRYATAGKVPCWRGGVPGDMKLEGRSIRMRVLGTAAIIALILAGPAYGQSTPTAKPPPPPPEAAKSQTERDSEKAADQAYKRSLGNIPDQPPADPWGIARSTDAPKAAAKVQTKRTKTGDTAN